MNESSLITVTAVLDSTYPIVSNITVDAEGKPQFHPSLTTALFMALQDAMNTKFAVKLTDGWGDYNETTSEWDGQIADLLNGEADFAIGLLTDGASRRKVVDFSLPVLPSKFSAFFVPPTFTADESALLRPFRTSIWVIVLACFAIALCFWWLVVVERKIHCQFYWPAEGVSNEAPNGGRIMVKNHSTTKHCGPISEGLLWSIGLLSSRGCVCFSSSTSNALHIAVLAVSIANLFLTSIHCGSVLSFLTVADEPFQNLEELLNAPYTFGFEDLFPLIDGIKNHPLPIVRNAYSRQDSREPFIRDDADFHEAKPRILAGSYALLSSSDSTREKFHGSERCLVSEIVIQEITTYDAVAIAKRSPVKQALNYHIIQFKQCGLNDVWSRRFFPQLPANCVRPMYESIPLGGTMVAIYAFGIGNAVAVAALLLECASSRLAR